MKIIKIGTFDSDGNPIGWELDGSNSPCNFEAATCNKVPHCLGFSDSSGGVDTIVTVNGVEIVEWGEKRKNIMLGIIPS